MAYLKRQEIDDMTMNAFAVDVIKKGDGLLTRLKEIEKENSQLKEIKAKLEKKVLNLEQTVEEYKKALNVLAKNRSDVNDGSTNS